MAVKGYLVYVPLENVASMEYGGTSTVPGSARRPDRATVATTPGYTAGPFEVREVVHDTTAEDLRALGLDLNWEVPPSIAPESAPDWEGDRQQAFAEADAELGWMIARWHRRKCPELTMTELAHILAGQVSSALKYALRAERSRDASDDGDGEADDDD